MHGCLHRSVQSSLSWGCNTKGWTMTTLWLYYFYQSINLSWLLQFLLVLVAITHAK